MTIQISAFTNLPPDTFRSTCSAAIARGSGNCAILILAQFGGPSASTNLVSASIGGVPLIAGTQTSITTATGIKFRAFWLADASAVASGSQTITLTASDGNAKIGFFAVVITDTGDSVIAISNETVVTASTGSPSTVVSSTVASAVGNTVVSMVRCDSSVASTPISPTTQPYSVSVGGYRQEVWLNQSTTSSTTSSASGWSSGGVEVDVVSVNVAAAPTTGVSGSVTLDPAVAAGTLASLLYSLSGTPALDDSVAAGALGVQPGVLTTPPLKNNTDTLLANVAGAVVTVYNSATGALVVRKTSVSSNSSAIISVSDSLLVPGVAYAYEIDLTSASLGRILPVGTAT